MEKTEKGRGDFADDVHPERSIDLGNHHHHQGLCIQNIGLAQQNSSRDLNQMNQMILGNGLYSQINQNGQIGSQNMINLNQLSHRDHINNELHPEYNFISMNGLPNNGYFFQQNSFYNYPRSIHHYYDESLLNISIADERRNHEHYPHSQIFKLEMKPQKHIHSMTEKKNNQEVLKEKRRNIDQDALEQMDPDCMSECSPQLIPKFTYCVNMPQNMPKEQSYEALRRANEQKYNFLKNASQKLNQSLVTTNYQNFLETSFQLAKDKPEECAHLLLTLETQFDLILHVNMQVPKEPSKIVPKPNDHDQDDDGGEAGDEGVD
ncbi:hypothetical protein ABPG72_002197 [Tetrahymena utriculariae]